MTSSLSARPPALAKINMARISENIRYGLEGMTSPFVWSTKLEVESWRHTRQSWCHTIFSGGRKARLDDCQNKQRVGTGTTTILRQRHGQLQRDTVGST